ncbi:unnamed protein product [Amoebophrya sp. A120]|nr:unnamed protein product [Amoebophrya sp. A120]|eukprot:GSA120T00014975001.1
MSRASRLSSAFMLFSTTRGGSSTGAAARAGYHSIGLFLPPVVSLFVLRTALLLPAAALLHAAAAAKQDVSDLDWWSRPAEYWRLATVEEKKCSTVEDEDEFELALKKRNATQAASCSDLRARRVAEADRFEEEVFEDLAILSKPWRPVDPEKEFGHTWQPERKWAEGREMTKEEKRTAHTGYCFNSWTSDSLPLVRPVPEGRHSKCVDYSDEEETSGLLQTADGVTASVVIVFYNELLSTLIRSLVTVLNRTPDSLLEEVVLVDDASDFSLKPDLDQKLKKFIETDTKKTKLLRLPVRGGLMRARVAGARAAVGEYLVFLDSHIECRSHWLEPLMAHMLKDKKNVVTPSIEVIGSDAFNYHPGAGAGGLGVLGFTWKLGQSPVPRRSGSQFEPSASPIMAGGLFGASREFFLDELEGYDPEFEIYGGEEMEIGFKVWQCHGRIDYIPCSAIGHVFRSSEHWQGQVFPVSDTVIWRNKRRAAAVWMDEYADLAKIVMGSTRGYKLGSLEFPLRVREKLKCKDFHWYMTNVYPEMYVPGNLRQQLDIARKQQAAKDSEEDSSEQIQTDATGAIEIQGKHQHDKTEQPRPKLHAGSIRSLEQANACMDTLGAAHSGQNLGLYPCHGENGSQAYLAINNQLRIGMSEFKDCVMARKVSKKVWDLVWHSCEKDEDLAVSEEEAAKILEEEDVNQLNIQEKTWANQETRDLLESKILVQRRKRYTVGAKSTPRPLQFVPLDSSASLYEQTGVFLVHGSLRCLEFSSEKCEKSPYSARLVKCDIHEKSQLWKWVAPSD